MRSLSIRTPFVSACIGRGAAASVIEACLLKRAQPFIGMALINEYRDVISRRNELFKNARLDERQRGLLLRAFVSCCQWQSVSFGWRPNLPDDGDNHVLELAIAANAAMIVTYNVKDFRRGELKFPHVEIAEPEIFLGKLGR